ncbi:LacI family DNA-binding transcriptional regulator [Limosilactobacillus sp.]|uniref:LacI family DNA-binding transcriptional regulator n=1 Tax=Limosilactobacillus sp. TaxID=2773925 RepID=UPI003F0B2C8B
MMTSIRQLAQHTGFSPATVSRVLNHDPHFSVKESTRQAIIKAAQQQGYQVGAHRQQVTAMQLQNSPVLVIQTPQKLALPYFLTIKQGIKDEAKQRGLIIQKRFTIPDPSFHYRDVRSYRAVILIGVFDRSFLEQLYCNNHNLVIIDDYRYFANYDLVRNNYEVATAQVLNHLYSLGHRRIAFIGGGEYPWKKDGSRGAHTTDVRTRTYKNWMQAHHLAAHTYETDWSSKEGAQAMKELVQAALHFDAVLTASDGLATGVYQVAADHHIAIPESLAVASFDDSQQAQQLAPSLSSVRPHSYEMGRTAVRLVLERLLEHRTVPIQAILPATFIKRESTHKENSD